MLPEVKSSDQIERFFDLYRLGYNLIPCNDKKPCVPWKRFQTERIPGANYKEWAGGRFINDDGTPWQLSGGFVNWALLTGSKPYSAVPALVCVDCDDAEAIELAQERCPATPAMQNTPKGGRHLLYRRPETAYLGQILGLNYRGRQWKLDFKADGNYIMAPGSRKTDGRVYQWAEPWTLEMLNSLPIFDPAWLPHEQQRKQEPTINACADHEDVIETPMIPVAIRRQQAQNYLDHCPGSEQGRGADCYCFALAMTLLWGFLLPAEDAHELLWNWGQKETNVDSVGSWYPWTCKEITHKINNAIHTTYEKKVGDRLTPDAYLHTLFEEIYGQTEKTECR